MDVLRVAATLHAAATWLTALRVRGISRRFPLLPEGRLTQARVTVVVPARNEEGNILACLASVLAQTHRDLEVVVVDDASTDATAEVAQRVADTDGRVRVVRLAGPPEGWAGKAHALHRGAALASGEWLLFTDADIRLAPDALERAVTLAADNSLDLVSGAAAQATPTFPWRLLLPVGQQLILTRAAPDGRGAQALAIGHFMLMRREAYLASGGYGRIPATTADDVDLATLLRDEGCAVQTADFERLLLSEQWRDWTSLWAGWRKSLHGGTGGDGPQLLAGGAVAAAYGLLPPTLLVVAIRRRDTVLAAVAVAAWLGLAAGRRPFDRQHGAGPGYQVLAPASWAVFGGIMLDAGWRALAGKGSPWKGRKPPR